MSYWESSKLLHFIKLLNTNWSLHPNDNFCIFQALEQFWLFYYLSNSLWHIIRLFFNYVHNFSFLYNSVHMQGKLKSFAYQNLLRNFKQIQPCNKLLALHSPVLSSTYNVSSPYIVKIRILYQNLNTFSCSCKIHLFFIFVKDLVNCYFFLCRQQSAFHSLFDDSALDFSKQLNIGSVLLFCQNWNSEDICLRPVNGLYFVQGVK